MPRPKAPRRTQAERTRAAREKIIQAATQLFAEQGFRGARMADIAAAAKMTQPGMLHHFPSKTHLLMEVLAERDRGDSERFDFSRTGQAGGPLTSLSRSVKHNQTVPGLVQLFTILVAESIQEDHPGHAVFLRRYQKMRGSLIEVLRQAQARAEVRRDIPADDLAVLVFAMMDGLQIQWLYEPNLIDMGRLFEQFARLLAGG